MYDKHILQPHLVTFCAVPHCILCTLSRSTSTWVKDIQQYVCIFCIIIGQEILLPLISHTNKQKNMQYNDDNCDDKFV